MRPATEMVIRGQMEHRQPPGTAFPEVRTSRHQRSARRNGNQKGIRSIHSASLQTTNPRHAPCPVTAAITGKCIRAIRSRPRYSWHIQIPGGSGSLGRQRTERNVPCQFRQKRSGILRFLHDFGDGPHKTSFCLVIRMATPGNPAPVRLRNRGRWNQHHFHQCSLLSSLTSVSRHYLPSHPCHTQSTELAPITTARATSHTVREPANRADSLANWSRMTPDSGL